MDLLALLVLLLLLPICFLLYLQYNYPGKVGLWFSYHLSHSNPRLQGLYRPREIRQAMHQQLYSKSAPLKDALVSDASTISDRADEGTYDANYKEGGNDPQTSQPPGGKPPGFEKEPGYSQPAASSPGVEGAESPKAAAAAPKAAVQYRI